MVDHEGLTAIARGIWALGWPGRKWPAGLRLEWRSRITTEGGSTCYAVTYFDDLLIAVSVAEHGDGFIDTLVHELAHIVAGSTASHGPVWKAEHRRALRRVRKALLARHVNWGSVCEIA